ncbi:MAG: hypothetical protein LC802_07595 [Acidobacteria bacterium]|nr:hypothetical protein [Acidobacteriota bacterium]
MSFSTRITVRFGDTDPAGLVYYPNIFHYFHIALEECGNFRLTNGQQFRHF